MAAKTEFLLSGDAANAQRVVTDALVGEGFAIEPISDGWSKITRGSMAKTVWLGAMAGKNMHVSYLLAFGTDPEGRPLARLDRDLAVGALKGGAIGASRTEDIYRAALGAIHSAATDAGILLGSRDLP